MGSPLFAAVQKLGQFEPNSGTTHLPSLTNVQASGDGCRVPAHVPLRSSLLPRHALIPTLQAPLFEWMLSFTCVLKTICVSRKLIAQASQLVALSLKQGDDLLFRLHFTCLV
jgi:hypothetical protein